MITIIENNCIIHIIFEIIVIYLFFTGDIKVITIY